MVERLEICIINVRDLRQHLTDVDQEQITVEECEVLQLIVADLTELLHCIEALSVQWSEYCDELVTPNFVHAYHCPVECIGSRERPRLCITRSQLVYLKSLSFTWSEIAAVLNVSRMTLYRRRVEYSMLQDDPSEVLTDSQLEQKLREMRQNYPQFGETMAMGHLRSLGYHITRERLRRAVRVTDPINRELRWRGELCTRRPYSVAGPNALWHLGQC